MYARSGFFPSIIVEMRSGIEMITKPKQDVPQDDRARGKRERRRREEALDEALKNTFPASDPVSVEQPLLPTAHTIDADS